MSHYFKLSRTETFAILLIFTYLALIFKHVFTFWIVSWNMLLNCFIPTRSDSMRGMLCMFLIFCSEKVLPLWKHFTSSAAFSCSFHLSSVSWVCSALLWHGLFCLQSGWSRGEKESVCCLCALHKCRKNHIPSLRKISSYLLWLVQFSLPFAEWCCSRLDVCCLVCFAHSGTTEAFL